LKRIAFHTLGCKLNFSETSSISKLFPKEEYQLVDFKEEADFYVINSCSVTQLAERKTHTAAKQAKSRNPQSKVTVMGCFSQLKPEKVAKLSAVDLVLGNDDKYNILEYLQNPNSERATEVHVANINKVKRFVPSYSSDDRTRSFLKVQDGCDHFCTYCSIPFARGRSRSASVAKTIETAKEIGKTSIREIILTGVNIGDFGKGTDENFYDLLVALEKVEGIERIRISSVEPELLTDEIIELVAKSNVFLPHFHLPLQSGSDKTLKDMKRFYDTALYADRIYKIKKVLPDACIAADVIVGFPTETDEDFADTMKFIADLPISYIHTFTYSERQNTFALKMENAVNPKQKKERSKMLHLLSDRKKAEFYKQNIGKTINVLFENNRVNNLMSGWTDNYIKVYTAYNPDLVNKIVSVKLDEKFVNDGFLVEI
jgi:threonylcarbamoyladenosine tRNA methylthiotransferase MtaB